VEERAQGRVILAALESLAGLLHLPGEGGVVHRRAVGGLEDAAHEGAEAKLSQVEDGDGDQLDPPLLAGLRLEGVADLLLHECGVVALEAEYRSAMLDAVILDADTNLGIVPVNLQPAACLWVAQPVGPEVVVMPQEGQVGIKKVLTQLFAAANRHRNGGSCRPLYASQALSSRGGGAKAGGERVLGLRTGKRTMGQISRERGSLALEWRQRGGGGGPKGPNAPVLLAGLGHNLLRT
jgi:hypothetical protein